MGWGIGLNWTHVELWKRLAAYWLAYVAVGLLIGWHLKPRLDELLFVLCIPIVIVVPWAIVSLSLAWLKLTMACAVSGRSHTVPRYRLSRRWRRGQSLARSDS